MAKEMLINTVKGQECRIGILADGRLDELYVERSSSASQVGNIYKGKVTNIEPSIQAAFIDFGGVRNGFLHISDIHPQYFPKPIRSDTEEVGRKRPQHERPPIQHCLRRGQEVVVQMTKEGIGTKGPTLTTYLSIPGRMLVMMPGMSRLGVSRKVEDDDARVQARKLLAELDPPENMGFIVRTAGVGSNKRELKRDLNYLLRLWQQIRRQIQAVKGPCEIWQESDLVTRTIRDIYNTDISRIICDDPLVARKVKDFLDVAQPRGSHQVELYTGEFGLFHDWGLEAEIERIYSRRVDLKSGGYLIIDQTEALVAIDINSGRFREHTDAEKSATKMNLEAAGEVARQLRLRDMGGVIIIDFIDMRDMKNRREVERELRDAMKTDRAKTKVLRISALGMVEMTRQRVRPSLKQSIYRRCEHCDGMGLIKSEESLALLVLRDLQRAATLEEAARIDVHMPAAAAYHLSNFHRLQIADLERQTEKTILLHADEDLSGQDVKIVCTNGRGTQVDWERTKGKPAPASRQTITIDEYLRQRGEESPPPLEDDEFDFAEVDLDEDFREEPEPAEAAAEALPQEQEPHAAEEGERPKRRRRRRRRKDQPTGEEAAAAQAPDVAIPPAVETDDEEVEEMVDVLHQVRADETPEETRQSAQAHEGAEGEEGAKRRRRRRRRRRKKTPQDGEGAQEQPAADRAGAAESPAGEQGESRPAPARPAAAEAPRPAPVAAAQPESAGAPRKTGRVKPRVKPARREATKPIIDLPPMEEQSAPSAGGTAVEVATARQAEPEPAAAEPQAADTADPDALVADENAQVELPQALAADEEAVAEEEADAVAGEEGAVEEPTDQPETPQPVQKPRRRRRPRRKKAASESPEQE